jgi:quercetin dioxygenase-like cupin family protein
MDIQPRQPTVKAGTDTFTGDVWFDVIAIRAGDSINMPPGEWHWHGAAPDRFMAHLAIREAPVEGPESEWGDQITDEEYLAPATDSAR